MNDSLSSPPKELRRVLKSAGLHYTPSQGKGFFRKRRGKSFIYFNTKNIPIKNEKVTQRINRLAIPPAYEDVWINPDPRGHIQAVGRDARGRKQYRYHPKWREFRDNDKFEQMIAFAKALPAIRRTTARHLKLRGLPKEKALAAVVQLLEKVLIRVGNDEYAKNNQSYGLTTLRNKHVQVRGDKIHFAFVGKHGIKHMVDCEDPRIAKIIRKCQDLPGQELFEFVDDQGRAHDIKSSDVNEYLQTITGQNFTAKDFRTWAGTLLAAKALQEYKAFSSQTHAKRQMLEAIEKVSRRLGNTKAICRKCYIHPAILNAHMDGSLRKNLRSQAQKLLAHDLKKLKRDEAAVLTLLQKSL